MRFLPTGISGAVRKCHNLIVNSRARLRVFAALGALAVLGVDAANGDAFGRQSANQSKATPTNASQAIMAAQAPLVTAAEHIKKLDPTGTGLGGIRLQGDKHTLEVWWKGDPPEAVRKEIARQQSKSGHQDRMK